jgi:hypothetical protein
MRSLGIFIDLNLPAIQDPGVNSATNRNEYQEYLLGGKSTWCVGLITLPPECEFWVPPGALKACDGIELILYIYIYIGCNWYRRLISKLYMDQSVKLNLD